MKEVEKKIEIPAGVRLDDVVKELSEAKTNGEDVFCDFNGHELHSANISIDSAYQEVMGCTKTEFDQKEQMRHQQYEEKERKAKEQAIKNIPTWIARGRELIFPERYEEWEKCVFSRVDDLYHGKELDSSLAIMEALKNGATIKEADKILNNQGHSGVSAALVRNIVFNFSNQGPEFWEATAFGEVSPESKRAIEAKKQENIKFANAQKKETSKKHI